MPLTLPNKEDYVRASSVIPNTIAIFNPSLKLDQGVTVSVGRVTLVSD